MQIIFIGKDAAVFSFSLGAMRRREETLIEQARKGPEELQRVCLWLENHGHPDLAEPLLERFV